MLARFEASPSLPTKEHTANTCLLLAHSGQDVPRLGRIVDAALATPPGASITPWLHLSKGLAEYRAGEGHYEAAVRHLDLSRPGLSVRNAEVTVDLLRAMCLHRLERAADAWAAYQDARRRFDRDVIRAGEGDLGDGGVENWLILQVIRREAADLFGDAVPATRPTTRPAAAAAPGGS